MLSNIGRTLGRVNVFHQSYSNAHRLSTVWCTTCRHNRTSALFRCSAKYHTSSSHGNTAGGGGGGLLELDTGQMAGGIPEQYPVVPIIPMQRAPIFPKFLKLIEVKDPVLIKLLRKQWSLAQPYAGVFLRKNQVKSDLVFDLEEIHSVGTFVKFSLRPPAIGGGGTIDDSLHVTLEGHRRIEIVSPATEMPQVLQPPDDPVERFLSVYDDEAEEEVDEDVLDLIHETLEGEDVGKNDDIAVAGDCVAGDGVAGDGVAGDGVAGDGVAGDGVAGDGVAGDCVGAGGKAIMLVNVENYDDFPYKESEQLKTNTHEAMDIIGKIMSKNPIFADFRRTFQMEAMKPHVVPNHLADFGAALCQAASEPHHLQEVLEERDVPQRLQTTLELLKRELDLLILQRKMGEEIEEKITVDDSRHILEQQKKVIEQELGIDSTKENAEIIEFRSRLEGLSVPESVKEVIEEEMNKLSFLQPHSSEFTVTRTYIDWLTSIPWGIHSDESFDINNAQTILDEDHYGLDDIKERILEFIAVGKLSGNVQGKILCFHGPPGVGKTSIGKSIARALNREYFRFSVGGMSDVVEIKGHRRTYIGALPGKIVQCLKKTKTQNPLILIDEVDKIGNSYKGDPASALLELLDPEQNSNFLDHYLDVPIDLSKVLFICTANTLDTIPGPLHDRMEMIQVSGYVEEEKIGIAEKYLIPTAMSAMSVTTDMVTVTSDTLKVLVQLYCRESGVRNLQKHIEKLFRKTAFRYVNEKSPVVVTADNLHEFVGNPRFNSEMMYQKSFPGVTVGLAFNGMGGSTLFVETAVDRQAGLKAGFYATGQLRDVMKESVQISYTFAKSFLLRHSPGEKFFQTSAIHLHVPEGATPKDGPSAGCAITTAFLSLALNRPIKDKLAMTGEISLTGKVLPVGGIKEKLLAARRSDIRTVLLPHANRQNYDELPEFLKKDLQVLFVKDYSEVFEHAFEHNGEDIALHGAS